MLAAALAVTLHSTNPSMTEFADFYEKGQWLGEKALVDSIPEELNKLKEAVVGKAEEGLEIRKDYYIASVYNFAGRQFLGIAGDFHFLSE